MTAVKSKVKRAVKKRKSGPRYRRFILNCVPSSLTDADWTYGDAVGAAFVDDKASLPDKVDLREPWWPVRNQGNTGACVGFATADGVLRWHYVKEKLIDKDQLVSPRFIWMANKETDNFTAYPTSFLDSAGTSTKLGLKVARKYGCVPEDMLPMKGALSRLAPHTFFSISSQYRINAFYNLKPANSDRLDLDTLKSWLSAQGPVLTRLDVDKAFHRATSTSGVLDRYDRAKARGGHAVCFVGYTKDHFIIRNSWGDKWGDNGFAYASYGYVLDAFTEAYGAVLNRLKPVVP